MQKKEKDIFLQEAVEDLKGDTNELPTESEEWTGSVDRGGLPQIGTAHLMDHEFRYTLTKKVLTDDDVQFNWTIASAAVEEDVIERLLDSIIKLYITEASPLQARF